MSFIKFFFFKIRFFYQKIIKFFKLKFTYKIFFFLFFTFFFNFFAKSQIADTLKIEKDTIKKNENKLDSPVNYSANDSLIFSMDRKKAYLFGGAVVTYQNIELKADYIELDMEKDIVFAIGVKDSTGKWNGKPIFKEGEEEFESFEMTYNFKTKQGFIKKVFSKQSDGYMHSEKTKIHKNKQVHIKNGKYTTCENEHPHFYIKMTKAKIIPNDKIVSGFSYLVIADVPTPICLPFGFFPNSSKRSSGIIIPSYFDNNFGFGLKDGGFYWAINDYMDLKLVGEIATRGSWKANPIFNYKKRYSYNGDFNLSYGNTKIGEAGETNYEIQKEFWLRWKHIQDPKFRPNSKFSANVNLGSSDFQKRNSNTSNDRSRNEWNSNISYSWNKSPFNFSLNLKHSQNSVTEKVNMTLPEMTFNLSSQRPFQKAGKKRWYEALSISYKSRYLAKTEMPDSLFLSSDLKFDNGFLHEVPISLPISIGKGLKLTPSVSYKAVANSRFSRKHIENNSFKEERISKIKYADIIYPAVSLSYTVPIYGMYNFKPKFINERIKAIRHVMTPNLSFNYKPDLGEDYKNRNTEFVNDLRGEEISYNIFEDEIMKAPTYGEGSGNITFSIKNNLEMKVKDENDTTGTGTKKIVLIDNFRISSAYDVFKDSLNFSKISLAGNTKLFKKIDISYSSSFDPYILEKDSLGRNYRTNKFELSENNRIARIENTNWTFKINYNLTPDMFNEKNTEDKERLIGEYDYFKMPWSLNFSYIFRNNKTYDYTNNLIYGEKESNSTQSLNFSGDLNLTEKWSLNFNGDYDFELNEITTIKLNIKRDLHCWEMSFFWSPLGAWKRYEFKINVKSGVLQDLKKEMRRNWKDDF